MHLAVWSCTWWLLLAVNASHALFSFVTRIQVAQMLVTFTVWFSLIPLPSVHMAQQDYVNTSACSIARKVIFLLKWMV